MEEQAISLVRGDWLYRVQRAVGLIPSEGLGVGRRAVFFALLAWLPVVAWAWWRGRALDGALDEPIVEHFGVHMRCLVAIPLLIVAEGMAHAVTLRLLPQFVRAGIVADQATFRGVLRSVAKLRDATLPWVIIAGLVLAWTLLAPFTDKPHELLWAVDAPTGGLGFGGWWYVYVSRPIYVTLVLAWLWRVVLLFDLMRRLSRMDLALVPTHPDRVGGLGFLTSLPAAFSLVVLALAAVAASAWGHDVIYHDATLQSLKLDAAVFVIVMLVVFLSPLAIFMPLLARTKKRALLEYAALIGAHGRAVHRKWIERQPVERDADLLEAPEIGPVADTQAIYAAVADMRTVPISKQSVMAVLVPAVLPMVAVVASRIPLKTILLSLLKALT